MGEVIKSENDPQLEDLENFLYRQYQQKRRLIYSQSSNCGCVSCYSWKIVGETNDKQIFHEAELLEHFGYLQLDFEKRGM